MATVDAVEVADGKRRSLGLGRHMVDSMEDKHRLRVRVMLTIGPRFAVSSSGLSPGSNHPIAGARGWMDGRDKPDHDN
jgi:hypothetical protein